MSEWKKRRKEEDWADGAENDDKQDAGYEKTYRDGSAVNECWAEKNEDV